MHALIANLSKDAFYQAKEAEAKLCHTHWTEREKTEGRKCYCSMRVEDVPSFKAYFRQLGFEVKFLPNQNPDWVIHARFIPMLGEFHEDE